MNPYNWRGNRPQVEVSRSGVEAVALDLKRGGSGVLLAGRGMGKSVFLWQVHDRLQDYPDVLPIFFPGPPDELTVQACLRPLARRLGVQASETLDTQEVLETFLEREADTQLVLVYDEFDRYARGESPAESAGRHFFNNLEVMRRTHEPRLGILAAGSIGVFLFRDVLGSSFTARADRVRIAPFGHTAIRELAEPFWERGTPLPEEVLDAVAMATGGVPALVTFGLESLWPLQEPTVIDVAEIYAGFQIRHQEFIRDFQESFANPKLSQAPRRVLSLIQDAGGTASHAGLREACASPDGVLRLRFDDALDLLQAAGLVAVESSIHADPVHVRPVASILTLPDTPSNAPEIRQRLREDLERLLAKTHAAGADFFRPVKGKELVPEAVFATYLALGFDLLGWRVEREAQHGAGRTDLKLRAAGSGELVVVEVKIWGRRHADVHRQVESYWSAEVSAGAVVMLTDRELPDWPDDYRATCLAQEGVEAELEVRPDSPIRARFAATSTTPDGMEAKVDHFLLRIPRRP